MRQRKIRKSLKVSQKNHRYLYSMREKGDSIDSVLDRVIQAAKIIFKKDSGLNSNKKEKTDHSVPAEMIRGSVYNEVNGEAG